MEHLTTTPFGRRSVAAGLVARASAHRQVAEPIDVATGQTSIDKWTLFRDLTTARKDYDLSDRALLVLNALLSFLPEKELQHGAQIIVFPSNRSLADRCHGMAESTLRRHLSALVASGLVTRHDSPNGKRYVRRAAGGQVVHAFGFDLSPLLDHAADICHRAEQSRRQIAEIKLIRERISLLRRDIIVLTEYAVANNIGTDLANLSDDMMELSKCLRRKLPIEHLSKIEGRLVDILGTIQTTIEPNAEETSGCDSQNERHHQGSNKEILESEKDHQLDPESEKQKEPSSHPHHRLPLALVLEACPEIRAYSQDALRDWPDLVRTAAVLRGMMGIDHKAWESAQRAMGAENAAITLACILQRFDQIRNPGGYLRSLSAKAELGCFSPAPMVMALVNSTNRVAA